LIVLEILLTNYFSFLWFHIIFSSLNFHGLGLIIVFYKLLIWKIFWSFHAIWLNINILTFIFIFVSVNVVRWTFYFFIFFLKLVNFVISFISILNASEIICKFLILYILLGIREIRAWCLELNLILFALICTLI
jgi:hypothetical protein